MMSQVTPNFRIKGEVDPMGCIIPNFQNEMWYYTEKLLSKKKKEELFFTCLSPVTLKNTIPVPQYKYFSSFQNAERVLKIKPGFCASAESEGANSTQRLRKHD